MIAEVFLSRLYKPLTNSLLYIGFNNDQLPFFNRIKLLDRFFLMENNSIVTHKVNDNLRVWQQSEKIKIIEHNNIQLLVMPYLQVNRGVEINDRSSHQKNSTGKLIIMVALPKTEKSIYLHLGELFDKKLTRYINPITQRTQRNPIVSQRKIL